MGKEKLISADKLLAWIENSAEAKGFWLGTCAVEAFDNLTDAIERGHFDPAEEIKIPDVVVIKETGVKGIIVDIQYEHNRYQLAGVSGWQYGIERIRKA